MGNLTLPLGAETFASLGPGVRARPPMALAGGPWPVARDPGSAGALAGGDGSSPVDNHPRKRRNHNQTY